MKQRYLVRQKSLHSLQCSLPSSTHSESPSTLDLDNFTTKFLVVLALVGFAAAQSGNNNNFQGQFVWDLLKPALTAGEGAEPLGFC
ncbi:hypothetical protein RvY_14757 [Ramazzottius varieornatus]|uniref:Uncharacterized protein n=1 Tax=Ramazzottius varieornatus TaxID=947166 RepID=A0A1D1VSE5_RAMVA|nr:hypothetical protein RvY_14757 [Ramazzottius varieornatus]